MKMIEALIRPEREREVIEALEKSGIYGFTRLDASGRGRQKGLIAGSVRYDELPKVWLFIAVEDQETNRAIDAIKIAARTGNPGDGKIFVSSLSEVRTIRMKPQEKKESPPLSKRETGEEGSVLAP